MPAKVYLRRHPPTGQPVRRSRGGSDPRRSRQVADDQRGEPGGIGMACHHARHIVAGDALAGRTALSNRPQIVSASCIAARPICSPVSKARVAARERGDAARTVGVTGRGPRMPAISPMDSPIARAVPLVWTLTCRTNGPGSRRNSNAMRAVGQPLVLAQVALMRDELAAGWCSHDERVVVGVSRQRSPGRCSSDCGARGRGARVERRRARQRLLGARLCSPAPAQSANASPPASRSRRAASPTAIRVATAADWRADETRAHPPTIDASAASLPIGNGRRMGAVERLERAIGDGPRRVAQP